MPSRAHLSAAAVTVLTLSLALTGCTSARTATAKSTTPTSSPATSSSTSASSASSAARTPPPGSPTQAQLKAQLINASQITSDTFTLSRTTPENEDDAVGIAALFANKSNNRVLSDIVIHFATVAYATEGVTETETLAAEQLTKNPATETKVKVGTSAELYQGANSTGPISILVFQEGHYIVTMEFVSKRAGDNIPASVVKQVGLLQDAKIKAAN